MRCRLYHPLMIQLDSKSLFFLIYFFILCFCFHYSPICNCHHGWLGFKPPVVYLSVRCPQVKMSCSKQWLTTQSWLINLTASQLSALATWPRLHTTQLVKYLDKERPGQCLVRVVDNTLPSNCTVCEEQDTGRVPGGGRIRPLHFLPWGSSQEKVLEMVINGTVWDKRIYITFTSLVGVFFHTVMLFTAIFVWTSWDTENNTFIYILYAVQYCLVFWPLWSAFWTGRDHT